MSLTSTLAGWAVFAASGLFTLSYAQTAAPAASGTAPMSTSEMTDGEVRKVDKENKKITLKHGEIKNLEMPGMTMVFQVKDPAMLGTVKTGDKVMFKAEKANGAMVVTEIQTSNSAITARWVVRFLLLHYGGFRGAPSSSSFAPVSASRSAARSWARGRGSAHEKPRRLRLPASR